MPSWWTVCLFFLGFITFLHLLLCFVLYFLVDKPLPAPGVTLC